MKHVMFGIGSVLVAGALISAAGCTQTVMKDESYIPVKQDRLPAAPVTAPVAEAEEVAPAAVAEAPAPAETPAPAVKTYPRFDSTAIKQVKSRPQSKRKIATVSAGGTYVVKSGDTLSHIALAHRVRVADIRQANSLKSDVIRVGQKLVIPGKGAVRADVKKTDSGKAVAAAPALTEGGYYVVKKGDNIPKIAKRFGVKASELQAANNLSDAATRRLQIGQKLVIPGKAAAAAAAAPTPATVAADIPGKTEAKVDALISDLPETAAPVAAPVDTAAPADTTAPAPVVAPADAAAPADTTAPAAVETTTAVQSEALESTIPDYMEKGTRLGDYLQRQNITLDTFKKYNPSALASFTKVGDNELDYVVAEDALMVFIPAK